MNITVTTTIPQTIPTIGVQPAMFKAAPEVTVPTPMITDVSLIGMPGPPGPAGTIVHVGPTPPPSPTVNDLWVDTT